MEKLLAWLAPAVLLCALVSTPAAAQEKSAVRQGFELQPRSGKRILVFTPNVHVGSQSAGGTVTPNADWTEKARHNIADALAQQQQQLGNTIVPAPEAYNDDARRVEEYSALFAAIADSVIEYQFVKGNRLPTKKHDNKEGVFDWSLGTGIHDLPGANDADYGLFIFDDDAYGSTGRKVLQVVALLRARMAVTSGSHRGYAGLVDLHTGDVLWMNADPQMGGDVRDPDGATKRVREMLAGFPGSHHD